jgi:hypothetical protein
MFWDKSLGAIFVSAEYVTSASEAIDLLLSHKVVDTVYVNNGLTLTTADKNNYINGIGASA